MVGMVTGMETVTLLISLAALGVSIVALLTALRRR